MSLLERLLIESVVGNITCIVFLITCRRYWPEAWFGWHLLGTFLLFFVVVQGVECVIGLLETASASQARQGKASDSQLPPP